MENLKERIQRVIHPEPEKDLISLRNKLKQEERKQLKAIIDRECEEFVEVDGHRIPKRPYHRWEFKELLPFELLYTKYAKHCRLSVFVEKGLKCIHPECEKVGTHLVITVDQGGGRHVDLVDANFELMTVDHILPKSQGGEDEMENYQPMCERHNSKKADKLIPY